MTEDSGAPHGRMPASVMHAVGCRRDSVQNVAWNNSGRGISRPAKSDVELAGARDGALDRIEEAGAWATASRRRKEHCSPEPLPVAR
jgi:hypothetical protein